MATMPPLLLLAQTTDDDIAGEGLFRAIALYQVGEVQKAEEWLRSFSTLNEQRNHDKAVALHTQAYYLAGIHAGFQGHNDQAHENFHQALKIDQSYLFARQALHWLKAGLLRGPAH